MRWDLLLMGLGALLGIVVWVAFVIAAEDDGQRR